MSETIVSERRVYSFWNTEACGTHFVNLPPGTPEFYTAYRKFRYATEWHIPELVPFADGKGRAVLEIGCGNGADGVMFAQNGAQYTGVDLTDAAVEATRKHFEVMGLSGQFTTANAEILPFPNESFDLVYSHGVLHHTQNPEKAFNQVYRVLKPGGRAIIMLYHKNSFNYFVRIMGYMRVRAVLGVLSKIICWNKDREAAFQKRIAGIRGNESPSVWQIHYENFLREGWRYFRSENFVHRCTDGPECPFAYVYTREGILRDFSRFSEVKTQVAHFPLRKSRWFRSLPLWIEKGIAKRWGWYLFVFARK